VGKGTIVDALVEREPDPAAEVARSRSTAR
jgi:hypothetical protein